jgi:hypothetical protein
MWSHPTHPVRSRVGLQRWGTRRFHVSKIKSLSTEKRSEVAWVAMLIRQMALADKTVQQQKQYVHSPTIMFSDDRFFHRREQIQCIAVYTVAGILNSTAPLCNATWRMAQTTTRSCRSTGCHSQCSPCERWGGQGCITARCLEAIWLSFASHSINVPRSSRILTITWDLITRFSAIPTPYTVQTPTLLSIKVCSVLTINGLWRTPSFEVYMQHRKVTS